MTRDPVPGLVAGLLVLCVYGGLALSVDFPRAAFGFQSDEATYYMMGQSLAYDRDLAYRREDLSRVWREFPTGPSGVFLKRGRDLRFHLDGRLPFLHVESLPDPDEYQLSYGKSYAYPLFAAPFVALFGTNGFLLFHAILLALIVSAGSLFLSARMPAMPAVLLATGFVMASVAPAYYVWITPEVFNLAFVFLSYFCWLYKEVAPKAELPKGLRWLMHPASDVVAVLLMATATFSKPSNLLLMGPLLLWLLIQRRWRRAFALGAVFGVCLAMFVAVNVAVSGDWNFQGGERRTFYGVYPFQNRTVQFDSVGQNRATDRLLTEVIFDRRVFGTVFAHNLGYFFAGRYSGLIPYFFPCVFALVAFLVARTRRAGWQWLVLATALVEILLLIVWIPYNYFGGGGVLGNRYFMNTYGIFLFLIPPISSVGLALVPWLVGGLFTAQIVLNPFYASFHPAEHAKQGPLRWLPVELTLVNDLPINTTVSRARVWFGTKRRFQIYFLDDNAYAREQIGEEHGFWVRGGSTAEILVKTVEPATSFDVALAAGDGASRVTISIAGAERTVDLAPGRQTRVSLPVDEGFPYQGTRVWHARVTSRGGFVPMFSGTSEDNRYLGVLVTPELLP